MSEGAQPGGDEHRSAFAHRRHWLGREPVRYEEQEDEARYRPMFRWRASIGRLS